VSILTYTEYIDIRTVLGVTEEELTDESLSAAVLSHTLNDEFKQINVTLQVDLDAAIAASPRTTEEQELVDAGSAFATYAVALQCLDSLPMLAPKARQEGKSSFTRFSDSPYKFTAEQLKAAYLRSRSRLLSAHYAYTNTESPPVSALPLCGISSPSSDPVTGT